MYKNFDAGMGRRAMMNLKEEEGGADKERLSTELGAGGEQKKYC